MTGRGISPSPSGRRPEWGAFGAWGGRHVAAFIASLARGRGFSQRLVAIWAAPHPLSGRSGNLGVTQGTSSADSPSESGASWGPFFTHSNVGRAKESYEQGERS